MEENHRKAIQNCIDVLAEKTNFSNVVRCLQTNNEGLLTPTQIRTYESAEFRAKSEEEQCRIFYQEIQTRGPTAFETLLNALLITGHKTEYEMLRKNRKASFHFEEFPWHVKMATAPLLSGTDVYRINSNPRGYYLIINNINFLEQSPRKGAENDINLKYLLDKMGYHGDYKTNLTGKDMEKHLQEFCSNKKLASVDSCIVAIMSHGCVSDMDCKVYTSGTDGKRLTNEGFVACNSMLEMFSGEECKLPKEQPRIFIFQHCRGDGEMHNHGVISRDFVSDSLMRCRDTFVLLPNVDGFVSNREQYGTWFILAICEVFAARACNTSLENMMGPINDRLAALYDESLRIHRSYPPSQQTAVLRTIGVSKELFFNPGLNF